MTRNSEQIDIVTGVWAYHTSRSARNVFISLHNAVWWLIFFTYRDIQRKLRFSCILQRSTHRLGEVDKSAPNAIPEVWSCGVDEESCASKKATVSSRDVVSSNDRFWTRLEPEWSRHHVKDAFLVLQIPSTLRRLVLGRRIYETYSARAYSTCCL